MPDTIVDQLYEDNKALREYLAGQKEISLQAVAATSFTKTLVLAAASFYETQIKDAVVDFAAQNTGNAKLLVEFIKNKAIERQYHTFFQWDKRNANYFFAFFGPEFAEYMRKRVNGSEDLQRSIAAFMELGELRNKLAHQNFAAFAVDKTPEEIYELHKAAIEFVDGFPLRLREFLTPEA